MTVYKPRSAWTSSGRGGAQLTGSKLVGIAWHWPGTSQDEIGVESEAQVANRLRGYRRFHLGRSWSDIGYNFAIDQAGRVWDLRGLGRVGAHCASPSNPDANHEWHGVLLILGDRERPSARMIQACQDFRTDVFLARWPGRTRDTGHGRAPGVPGAQTSCPGPFAAELIVDGVLTDQPTEDDMTPEQERKLDEIHNGIFKPVVATEPMLRMWPGFPEDGYTPRVYSRTSYVNTRVLRDEQDKQDAKLDALLAAQEGLDTAAVLERIDARHDAAAAERAEILALVAAVGSGERDAADVVDEIARRLSGEDSDDA